MLTRSLRRDSPTGNLGVALRAFAAGAFAILLIGLVIGGAAAATAVYSWTQTTSDLPNYKDVEALDFETTKIYDRDGRLLHEVSDPMYGWRTAVEYEEIVENVQRNAHRPGAPQRPWIFDAIVAAEDATFWTNQGVDPVAIGRSLVSNLAGGPSSGASTITQQTVRAMFPESIGYEQTYTRKIREAVMALRFDQQYEKEEILEMYLNNVYFGNRAYGIDAAAQSYFNKFAWNLSLAEATMLAGLPQAPSIYDPTVNYDLAKQRQRYVLDQMAAQGMITEVEADDAYAQPLNPQRREGRHDLAPHFVNYVRYQIEQQFGAERLFRGGLRVTTTLDYELQLEAEKIVREGVAELEPWSVNNGALIAMRPWSGEIIAMVGSADYYNDAISGQVNVTTRERQPGSSIKPVTYLAALEKGWHPGTIIFDYGKEWETPLADQPTYAPLNASGQFYGAISMREALANSLNIPAVQALDYVGVGEMINLAHEMGIKTGLWRGLDHYGLAITLGGGEVSLLEHTNVFGTLANNGRYVPKTPFLEIVTGDGEVLYKLDRETVLEQGEQVAQPEHAYQVTDILSDNDARSMIFGTNSPLTIPELGDRPIAAKTGTTDDNRDGWTMGYSTALAAGVWVGNTDNSATQNLNGVTGAAPIWNEFMAMMHTTPAYQDLLLGPDGEEIPVEFPRPEGIIEGEVCATTGKRPIPGVQTETELLVEGEGPQLPCDEMNEYEEEELEAAIDDAESNGRFTSRGIQTLHEYALMVGVRSQLIETPEPQIEPEFGNEVPEDEVDEGETDEDSEPSESEGDGDGDGGSGSENQNDSGAEEQPDENEPSGGGSAGDNETGDGGSQPDENGNSGAAPDSGSDGQSESESSTQE